MMKDNGEGGNVAQRFKINNFLFILDNDKAVRDFVLLVENQIGNLVRIIEMDNFAHVRFVNYDVGITFHR